MQLTGADATGGGAVAGVLALPGDLVFASRIRGSAAAVGIPIAICARPEALLEQARAGPPALVVIDLDARGWDPVAVVHALVSAHGVAGERIVAFVSHVRADAIAAARAAGAGRVLARSAFVRELPDLLRSAIR